MGNLSQDNDTGDYTYIDRLQKKVTFQWSRRSDLSGHVYIQQLSAWIDPADLDDVIAALRDLSDRTQSVKRKTGTAEPFKKGDRVRRRDTGVVRTVEAYHPGSNRLWLHTDHGPVTYENATLHWEVVRPFFEEGKTYRHDCGNTFKVETVRGEGDNLIAFGLINEGGSTENWETRDASVFRDWKEAR